MLSTLLSFCSRVVHTLSFKNQTPQQGELLHPVNGTDLQTLNSMQRESFAVLHAATKLMVASSNPSKKMCPNTPIADALWMMQQSYSDNKGVQIRNGFLRMRSVDDNGYQATAFLNMERKLIVIANRGTSSIGHFKEDVSIALTGLPTYARLLRAHNFAEEIGAFAKAFGFEVEYVGHSMGGVDAVVTAISRGEFSIVADAPVNSIALSLARRITQASGVGAANTPFQIVQVVGDPNPINTFDTFWGRLGHVIFTHSLSGSGKTPFKRTAVEEIIRRHSIVNIFNAYLKRDVPDVFELILAGQRKRHEPDSIFERAPMTFFPDASSRAVKLKTVSNKTSDVPENPLSPPYKIKAVQPVRASSGYDFRLSGLPSAWQEKYGNPGMPFDINRTLAFKSNYGNIDASITLKNPLMGIFAILKLGRQFFRWQRLSDKEKALERVRNAINLVSSSDKKTSKKYLQQLVDSVEELCQKNKDDPALYFFGRAVGFAARNNDTDSVAQRDFKKILNDYDTHVRSLKDTLIRTAPNNEADSISKELLRCAPHDPETRILRAAVLQSQGNFEASNVELYHASRLLDQNAKHLGKEEQNHPFFRKTLTPYEAMKTDLLLTRVYNRYQQLKETANLDDKRIHESLLREAAREIEMEFPCNLIAKRSLVSVYEGLGDTETAIRLQKSLCKLPGHTDDDKDKLSVLLNKSTKDLLPEPEIQSSNREVTQLTVQEQRQAQWQKANAVVPRVLGGVIIGYTLARTIGVGSGLGDFLGRNLEGLLFTTDESKKPRGLGKK